MKNLEIYRATTLLRGTLTLPGDKSISHRAAILAAIAEGTSTITGFLESEDCLATIAALQQLGIESEHPQPGTFVIHGKKGILTPPSQPIYCGNSGTTMRLLAGLLAAQPFCTELTGDDSLSRRPMKRIIDPLQAMGARLRAIGSTNHPPLSIEGAPLQPLCYTLPVASAQVKSALLLAALFTSGETIILEPTSCRDHTERMFSSFQIACSSVLDSQLGAKTIRLIGPQRPKACNFQVPGDISSAAFWLVAAAAQKGSQLRLEDVGLNPTRTGILSVLKRMGAGIDTNLKQESQSEPLGTLTLSGTGLTGTIIQGVEIPNVIDELPILAVAGALAQGTTIIRDAQELRVKETDRITAIVTNLRAMGASVTEHDDGLEIHGGAPLHGTTLQSYGDHRIAMAFAIAGLFAKGSTTIENVDCIATSYPKFEQILQPFVTTQVSP